MTTRSSTLIHFEVADLGHRHVKGGFSVLDIGDNSIHFSGSTALVDAMIAELVALRNEMEPYGVPPVLNPPHHALGTGEEECGAEHDGWICTAQADHDGPEHVAYGTEGHAYDRWPAAITDSERDCPETNPDGSGEHCHKSGPHAEHRDSNGSTWATNRETAGSAA